MAASKLLIHIPPDANPSNITDLVCRSAQCPDKMFGTVSELTSFLSQHNVSSRTEIPSVATNMGLLEKNKEGICISSTGLALVNIRNDSKGDLLHFLMYSGWSPNEPMQFLPSWAYRHCCLRYWHEGKIELTPEYLNKQVGEMIAEAPVAFSQLGEFGGVSFSRKSLTGAHYWLSALHPPVLDGKTFSLRSFCQPELLVLALGYVLRDDHEVTGIDILLSREKRYGVCQVCMLEPEHLDRTLDWALTTFPEIIEPGTTAGSYGRFIRLNKLPTINDVVR